MKAIFVRAKLKTTLEILAGIIPRNPTLPVIKNVLVELEGVALTMKATDLNITIKLMVDTESIDPGEGTAWLVDPASLLNILKASAEAKVSLTFTKSTCRLTEGLNVFEYPVSIDVNTYPAQIDMDSTSKSLEIKMENFNHYFGDATKFVSAETEGTNVATTGVHAKVKGGNIITYATNGSSMFKGWDTLPGEAGAESGISIVVHPKFIHAASSLMYGHDDKTINLVYNEKNISFGLARGMITGVLIQAKSLPFEQVAKYDENAEEKAKFKVNRKILAESLEKASNINFEAKLRLSDGTLFVQAENKDTNSKCNIQIATQDAPKGSYEVKTGIRRMLSVLSIVTDETAELHMGGASGDNPEHCKWIWTKNLTKGKYALLMGLM